MTPWLNELLDYVRARGHLHLFADFDGTLAPIAPTPEAAQLPPAAGLLLQRLVARPRTSVAIVSGRPLETLQRKVPIDGLDYVGNHGMEWIHDGVRQEHPLATAARPAVARLAPHFAALVDAHGGVLEDKGISLSLHTRLIDDDSLRARVEGEAWALAGREPALAPFAGKRIVEVRPRGAPDKGDAILALLTRAHGDTWPTDCAALFIGDDVTDEDGFRALGANGASILVADGPARPTAARYTVPGVPAVYALLAALIS